MKLLNENFGARLLTIAVAVFFAAFLALAVLSMNQAQARGRGGGGRGGGGRGGGISRPSGGGRGGGISRPSGGGRGGGISRPSGGYGARPSPGARPAPRPAPRPTPGARPTPGVRPGMTPARPGTGPGRPSTLPARPGGINTGRNDINIDRGDVNIDVDQGWGHNWDDDFGAFAAGAVIGGVTGAAIAAPAYGTTVYSLPPSCSTTVVNGVTYSDCGGVYYQPSYEGTTIAYEAVAPPY